MTRGIRLLTVAALAGGLLTVPGQAVAAPSRTASAPVSAAREPMDLVIDVSGSMADHDRNGSVKIEGAKTGILDLLNKLPVDSRIGLWTYPSGSSSCGAGQQQFQVEGRDPAAMSAVVRTLHPDGDTPTAEALRAVGADLKANGFTSATILLVSDGESTCDPPCPVAQELAAAGLQVTVRGMGFDIDEAGAEEMRCLADATGGSYTEVTDATDLAAQLSALSTSSLDVQLAAPTSYNPAPQSSLPMLAKITNTSGVDAADVRATLSFDPTAARGALVTPPQLLLGNVGPGHDLQARWMAYPDRGVTSGSLAFTVVVTSRGSPPVVTTGSIRIVNRLSVKDAGPLLRDAQHVVVLGDSYSSGEGAGDYDKDAGKCDRSPHTYAYQLWPGKATNLACSGAVTRDHTGHQTDRGSRSHPWPSQREQLTDLDGDPDLVLLTMGGNDVNFPAIVRNCLFEVGCSGLSREAECAAAALNRAAAIIVRQILCSDGTGKAAQADPLWWSAQLASLRPNLAAYYEQVLADAGEAKVVVLPYVEVVPNTGRGLLSCVRPLPGVDPQEFELIRWLQAELNNQIAAAVRDVRAGGFTDRLYFAEDVATALQPDHTLCSDGDHRWLNPVLSSFNEQEYVHPNADGYRAIAAGLVRWSATMSEPSVLPSQPKPPGWIERGASAVVDSVESTWQGFTDGFNTVKDFVLDSPNSRIITNPLRIHSDGFGPGQSVVLGVGSTLQTLGVAIADEYGDVVATVELPAELRPGEHVLFAAGFTDDGNYRVEWAETEIAGPGVGAALVVTGLSLLLCFAGLLVIRRARRRPVPGERQSARG